VTDRRTAWPSRDPPLPMLHHVCGRDGRLLRLSAAKQLLIRLCWLLVRLLVTNATCAAPTFCFVATRFRIIAIMEFDCAQRRAICAVHNCECLDDLQNYARARTECVPEDNPIAPSNGVIRQSRPSRETAYSRNASSRFDARPGIPRKIKPR
jgi:hypothetical protein